MARSYPEEATHIYHPASIGLEPPRQEEESTPQTDLEERPTKGHGEERSNLGPN